MEIPYKSCIFYTHGNSSSSKTSRKNRFEKIIRLRQNYYYSSPNQIYRWVIGGQPSAMHISTLIFICVVFVYQSRLRRGADS